MFLKFLYGNLISVVIILGEGVWVDNEVRRVVLFWIELVIKRAWRGKFMFFILLWFFYDVKVRYLIFLEDIVIRYNIL